MASAKLSQRWFTNYPSTANQSRGGQRSPSSSLPAPLLCVSPHPSSVVVAKRAQSNDAPGAEQRHHVCWLYLLLTGDSSLRSTRRLCGMIYWLLRSGTWLVRWIPAKQRRVIGGGPLGGGLSGGAGKRS